MVFYSAGFSRQWLRWCAHPYCRSLREDVKQKLTRFLTKSFLGVLTQNQCWGSGSAGSAYFFGLPDPDPISQRYAFHFLINVVSRLK
jgi:hypothetical protein